MRRLRYHTAAQADLVSIARYLRDTSGSVVLARRFVEILRGQCRKLAALPGELGRPRPELAQNLRSWPFKAYVIFFKYDGDDLIIVNILERHRDIASQFDEDSD